MEIVQCIFNGDHVAERSSSKQGFGDWGVVGIATVLAFLVWFHAVTEHGYRKEIEVPLLVVDPTSASGEELLVANPLPTHVKVLVSGSGKKLLFGARGEEFLIKVEPPSGRPGAPLSVRLTPDQVEQRQQGVRVEEILQPREIGLILERRVSRDVAVEPFVQFEVADSYTPVGGVQLEPATVRVSGPRSQVEALQTMKTDSLVLTSVSEDVEVDLPLLSPPQTRLTLSHANVRVSIDIQELAEYDIPNVPVEVRNAGGAEVVAEPSRVQVTVRGGADVIGRLDSERDLHLYVDHVEWSRSPLEGGIVQLDDRGDSLFEVRQVVPSRVNIVRR